MRDNTGVVSPRFVLSEVALKLYAFHDFIEGSEKGSLSSNIRSELRNIINQLANISGEAQFNSKQGLISGQLNEDRL